MPFIEDDPPRVFPRSCCSCRPASSGSGSPLNAQLCLVLLRFNKTGQHSGRDPLPSFVVKSKNRKNIKVNNYKQWIAMWEEAKNKCIPRKWTYKYPLPTFKNSKRDLPNVI